jgi:agmatine deiminase
MPQKTKAISSEPTPASLGHRMPAEWEPHAATWLAWPHYHGDWPGKFEPIPWVYAEIIRNLAKHERVELIVNNAAAERHARRVLQRAEALSGNIRFHRWPTNRIWLRDSGCIFLSPTISALAPAALKFRFNAWAKYSNWRFDEKIGSLMATVGNPTLRKSRRVGQPLSR